MCLDYGLGTMTATTSEVILNPTDILQIKSKRSKFTSFHIETTCLVFSPHKVDIYGKIIDKYRPCHAVSAIIYLRTKIAFDIEISLKFCTLILLITFSMLK